MNEADTAAFATWQAEELARALRQVRSHYLDYNASLFGDRLHPAQLVWSEQSSQYGAWRSEERVLELSVSLLDLGWGHLVEVLKHEMAHQYVDEVMGCRGEGPHGPTFRAVCEERGIDARAAGAPRPEASGLGEDADGAPTTDERGAAGTRARIQRLLALAQSDNQHEAEAAMRAARRLMLKYNLDEALATSQRGYSFRHLGRPTGRRMAWQKMLGHILSSYFFVEVIIVPVYRPREGKRGSVLEACGTPANLEIAAYVHDFLERAAEQSWKAHKRRLRSKSNRERQSYLAGVMRGFLEKLEQEATRNRQEGLVWVGDPTLRNFFRRRHPHIRSVSGSGRVQSGAFSAGQEAGRRIVLHRGVEGGDSKGAPRLLGRGGRA